jgi:hypothetical protein
VLGRVNQLGSIEPGEDADIVALAASPLNDVTELQRIRFVMRTEAHLERARRDEPSRRLRANKRRQAVLRRERGDHLCGTRRVLVDEQDEQLGKQIRELKNWLKKLDGDLASEFIQLFESASRPGASDSGRAVCLVGRTSNGSKYR